MLLFISLTSTTILAADELVEFQIERQAVNSALLKFAQESQLSILFPSGTFSEVDSNPLIGRYTIEHALRILLDGTGVAVSIETGQLIVSTLETANTIKYNNEIASEEPNKDSKKSFLNTLTSFFANPNDSQGQLTNLKPIISPDEIIVTGSRIRRDSYSTAQPTSIIDNNMTYNLGIVNLGDAVFTLPSNISTYTPTTKPGGNENPPYNVNNGSYFANLRGLNTIYGSRTLTLVDSRRHVPSSQGDAVDLNMIPSILMKRMEVVTGGTSASYGSGAIGGVVNIILDHDLEGGKIQFDYGMTNESDGDDKHSALAWGKSFSDNSHFVIGFEDQKMDAIENCMTTRTWCAQNGRLVRNRNYTNNEEPNYVYRENVRSNINSNGVFTNQNLTLSDDGRSTLAFSSTDEFNSGGDGREAYKFTTLRANVDRQVLFSSYRKTLSDSTNFFIEGSLGKVESYTPQRSIDITNTIIQPDNFFLNQLDNNPCSGSADACLFSKDLSDQATTANSTSTDLKRFAFGFNGEFTNSTWNWDAYYQYGKSDLFQAVYDSRRAASMQFATDAIDDGTGNPVCRVTLNGIDSSYQGDTRLANGCVPINLFGTNNISTEAFDYTFGRLLETTEVKQDFIEAIASGEVLPNIGEQPILAALGLSWRKESIINTADPLQPEHIRRDYNSQFGESFSGKVGVWEYFAELEAPVTDKIAIQAAIRRSHYSNTAGEGTGIKGQTFDYGITTWKINSSWQPKDWITFRASHSLDIRAPNFRDLYFRKVFPAASRFGYCSNLWTDSRDPCVLDFRGGLELEPEESKTTTAGLILSSSTFNTRFAADYYNIKIDDAITAGSTRRALSACYYETDLSTCSQISGTLLDPANPYGGFSQIDNVTSQAINIRAYKIQGLDFTADWVSEYDFGTISTQIIASHMIKQLVQTNSSSLALANITGVTGYSGGDWESAPDWTGQWITSFQRGNFSLTTQARFVSEGRIGASFIGPQDNDYNPNIANSIDDNRISAYIVWALNGSYKFTLAGTKLNIFTSIQNIFNKSPPLAGIGVGGANPSFYDTIGRNYRLGMRATF